MSRPTTRQVLEGASPLALSHWPSFAPDSKLRLRNSARGLCTLHASDASQANSRSHACFPLTPTLSLGERGNRSTVLDEPKRSRLRDASARALPLPQGEG